MCCPYKPEQCIIRRGVFLMNKLNMTIWGRAIDLSIVFDCYDNKEILPAQRDALDKLLNSKAIESSKAAVESYCLEINKQELGESGIFNIFKYVMPHGLFVRRPTSSDRYVGLMCKYRFNPEDGLAVLFKNEEVYNIGTSDIL